MGEPLPAVEGHGAIEEVSFGFAGLGEGGEFGEGGAWIRYGVAEEGGAEG